MLARMAKAQTRIVDEIWKSRAPDLPIRSPGELVTLASIVEKETGKADERPHVAGVFVNRLEKHMRLQSDPTIVYGLVFGKGTLGHPITKAELNQPTPYNTYLIDGLPPGPISNPGKAALEAVANPAHGKDLYFVADGTGGHVFSETLDQHLQERRALAADREGRQGPAGAGRDPADVRRRQAQRTRARRSGSLRRARSDRTVATGAGRDRPAPRQDRREPSSGGERAHLARRRPGRRQDDRGHGRRGGRRQRLAGRGGGVRR